MAHDSGVVMAFTGYAALRVSPLGQMSHLMSGAFNTIAGDRVYAIIDEEPTVLDAPDADDDEFDGGINMAPEGSDSTASFTST